MKNENPVNCETARIELGKPGKPWGASRMSAIKRAMGITSRYFFLSDVRRWLRANPNFREQDIYPKKNKVSLAPSCSQKGLQSATAG